MAALIGMVVTTLWVGAGLVALVRGRRVRPRGSSNEAVSVLKPLRGADDALAANLRTFFELRHPRFELVFGVEGPDDPALAVARALRAEYPHVACKLVVHRGGRSVNPKVRNLQAMLAVATYDVLLISDSNIAVTPETLDTMVACLSGDVGLVTSPIAGFGEQSLGAALESVALCTEVAPDVALATRLGHPIVVGKSMLFRRSVFERLGGFDSVGSVLAEDYVIGRMFHAAGLRVVLSPHPVYNVCRDTSVSDHLRRHLRWSMIRLRLQPAAFLCEPLARPLVMAGVVILLGVPAPIALVWALVLSTIRDTAAWYWLRGPSGVWRVWLLAFPRAVLASGVWLATPFVRHVAWRGHRVRVSAGTHLYASAACSDAMCVTVEE